MKSEKVADGVWYITGVNNNSALIEMKDYLIVVEAPHGERRSLAVLGEVKKLVPNKPIKYFVNTHHHFDHAYEMVEHTIHHQLKDDPAYQALLKLKGIGPTFAAVFIAEIGDVTRFGSPHQLACWAGLTPRLYSSDTKTRQGHSPSRDPGWPAVGRDRGLSTVLRAVCGQPQTADPGPAREDRHPDLEGRRGPQTAPRRLLRAARRARPLPTDCAGRMIRPSHRCARTATGMTHQFHRSRSSM